MGASDGSGSLFSRAWRTRERQERQRRENAAKPPRISPWWVVLYSAETVPRHARYDARVSVEKISVP